MRPTSETKKYLHLNSSAIKIAGGRENGIITFAKNADNIYTLSANTGTERFLNYKNGAFGVSTSEAVEVFFFIYTK